MINFLSGVFNLEVTIDGLLTMREHMLRNCRTPFYHLRQLRASEGRSISTETCTALVHVSSRLDYCNSLFAGLSDELTNKLQSVLPSAVRLGVVHKVRHAIFDQF